MEVCKEVDGGERAVSEVQAMPLLAVKGRGGHWGRGHGMGGWNQLHVSFGDHEV